MAPSDVFPLVAVLACGCAAGPRPMSPERLAALSMRSYEAQYEEVYDANWLAAERLGYTVVDSDRRLGTFEAKKPDGRTWSVTVTPRDSAQHVTAVPGPARTSWLLEGEDGELAQWDELELRARALLEVWRNTPDWVFTAAKNDLSVGDFHVNVPREWATVDTAVDRRHVTVQRFKPPHEGLNATFFFELDRRRPVHPRAPLIHVAAGHALEAHTRLDRPKGLDVPLSALGYVGDITLHDGPTDRPVRWYLWDVRTREWTIRIAGVCGQPGKPGDCESEWRRLVASVVSRGFEFPRTE